MDGGLEARSPGCVAVSLGPANWTAGTNRISGTISFSCSDRPSSGLCSPPAGSLKEKPPLLCSGMALSMLPLFPMGFGTLRFLLDASPWVWLSPAFPSSADFSPPVQYLKGLIRVWTNSAKTLLLVWGSGVGEAVEDKTGAYDDPRVPSSSSSWAEPPWLFWVLTSERPKVLLLSPSDSPWLVLLPSCFPCQPSSGLKWMTTCSSEISEELLNAASELTPSCSKSAKPVQVDVSGEWALCWASVAEAVALTDGLAVWCKACASAAWTPAGWWAATHKQPHLRNKSSSTVLSHGHSTETHFTSYCSNLLPLFKQDVIYAAQSERFFPYKIQSLQTWGYYVHTILTSLYRQHYLHKPNERYQTKHINIFI